MLLIALPYPTMTFLSYYVAVEKGFFAGENIDVNYMHVDGGKDKIMEMFLKGEVHFLYALWEMVEIALKGLSEIRCLCGSVTEPVFLFVRPGIATIEDLRSKTIMAGISGSGSEVQTRYLLHKAGLDPDTDVNLISGNYIERVQALQDTKIHACQDRFQTWYWAKKAGWSYLGFEDADLCMDSGGLSTSLTMIREQPATVMKVVKAIARAVAFMKENREESIEVARNIITYLNYEEIAGQYDLLHDHFTPDISLNTIDFMVNSIRYAMSIQKKLQYEDLVERSFLQQAESEMRT